jgi:hypothetical protein
MSIAQRPRMLFKSLAPTKSFVAAAILHVFTGGICFVPMVYNDTVIHSMMTTKRYLVCYTILYSGVDERLDWMRVPFLSVELLPRGVRSATFSNCA